MLFIYPSLYLYDEPSPLPTLRTDIKSSRPGGSGDTKHQAALASPLPGRRYRRVLQKT